MRRFLFVMLALLVATFLGAGWYMYQKGFTRRWRVFVSEEFRKRGAEVSLRKLVLVPFRGIVAQDVKVYDGPDRRRTLLVVDEMQLRINYAELFKKRPFLEALDLRDARLSVPLDPQKPGPAFEVNKLSGRLLLPPQQIYLSRLEAEIYGIKVSASGRLVNPGAFKPKPRTGSNAETVSLMERIITELKALRHGSVAPRLDIRFSGDMAEMDKLFVEASLSGRKIERSGYTLRKVEMHVDYRGGRIELKRALLEDSKGALDASGRYDVLERSLDLRLRSGLDLWRIASVAGLGQIGQQMAEIQSQAGPNLDMQVDASFRDKPSVKAIGNLSQERFRFRGVPFNGLTADFSWVNGDWSVRSLNLGQGSGSITADVMNAHGEFRAKARSTVNPQDFGSLFTGDAAQVYSQFRFKDAPVLDVEVQGTKPDLASCTVKAQVKLGRSSFRDSAAEHVEATVKFADRRLSVEPFRLRRAEGESTGGVVVDFARNEVSLNKIRATVVPQEVVVWFEPKLLKDIQPYRFKKAPNLYLDGVIHVKGGDTTRLAIDVDAPQGMDYFFLKKNLSASQVSGKLLFTDKRLKISALNASLLGGKLRGEADISLVKGKPGHSATMSVEDMDFAAVTKLYFNYDTSKGHLAGTYTFSGRGDDVRAMKGNGKISVRDGNVFAIPFMGPLSGVLDGIVPGMGHDVAKKLDATFAIADGVLTTNDLDVAGNGFSMFGQGKLMFVDDAMDFSVRINARGLPGVLLFPVSKLFEYVADEKLSKPRWHPKALRSL